MSEGPTIICHGCGAEVPDWMRFHHQPEGCGQYTTPDPRRERATGEEGDGVPANIARAAEWWSNDDAAPFVERAPPPGDVPPKPWPLEEELRRSANDFLARLGWDVYDLEQGFRADGSSRVAEGIGDTYILHTDLRVAAWVEYKRWDNEPSEDQTRFARRVLDAGGIYLLVYETAQLVAWHELVRRRDASARL